MTSSVAGTYGLSGSGIDVDTIVKSLMTAQQTKLDKLTQKKTVVEWQKAAYNKVYDDINTFNNSLYNFKLQKTLAPNVASTSNTSVVTAKASAAALNGTHSVVVAQLASGVNLTSTEAITPTDSVSKTSITNQFYAGTTPTGSFEVTIANGDSSATITVDPAGTLNDLVSQINSAGIDVQASYDSTLDRFFLASTNTGSSAEISITDVDTSDTSGTEFFIDKLNLSMTGSAGSYTSTGKDAVFQLDGVRLTEASNSFTISNVSYTLTGVSAGTIPADITGTSFTGTAANVSVTKDVDTAVASVKTLVESYNKILEELNDQLEEARYTDYPPLTEAQEEEMSETEIEKWNAKAESGMLYSDPTLTSLVNAMRSAFSNVVSSATTTYNNASSIGITTGDYTEGGKLYLDTDQLETALSANPNVLYELFGASGAKTTTTDGTTTTTTEWKNQGIAGRIYDSMKTSMTKLKTIASITSLAESDSSSNLALRLIALDKQIDSAEDTFDMMEDTYYTRYNAMEVALQSLSSQSSWITSMLDSSS